MLLQSLVLLAAYVNLAHCGPVRCQNAARYCRYARSYNQTSSTEITTSCLSTFLNLPSATNLASQHSTTLLGSGINVSTTTTVTSTSLSSPSGQVGQVPAFANDPAASTIANDASALMFSRSFTLGTAIATAIPTVVQQGVPSRIPTTNTVAIISYGSSTTTLGTSPVSLSFQTVISPTLSTLTSSVVSVTPTTGVIILTTTPMTLSSPGSFTGFSTSTVTAFSTITLDSSRTSAQSHQSVTLTQTPGVSSARAPTSNLLTTFSAIATTSMIFSSPNSTAATNATVPNSQDSNLVLALAYNAIFDTLTIDSDCSTADSSSAVACISGNFAQCGSDGKYTLTNCPRGQQCFALPLSGGESGVSVQCDSSEDGASKLGLAAAEATGVVSTTAISSMAVLSPLTSSTSSTAITSPASKGARSSVTGFATQASSTRSRVIVPQVSVPAQSTTIDISPLAFGASLTTDAPQVVTFTPKSIAGSSTRVASLSGTVKATKDPDILSFITTMIIQASYTTSTSIAPKAPSGFASTNTLSFDSQGQPTSNEIPLLSISTYMPASSQDPLSSLPFTSSSRFSSSALSSTSTTVVLITKPSPSTTQAPTYQTTISSTTALSSLASLISTPAFTIVPVKNNATPTITETITETVTVSATVTVPI